MKSFLLLMILIVSCCHCFAQLDTAISFIEDAIRSRKSVNKIVYLDSSITFYQPFHVFIKRGNLVGFKGQQEVKMKFTAREVRYLDQEFQKKTAVEWKEALFTNSVRINRDTLLLLGKDANSYAYFKRNFAEKYFYFSQPVFIRNGTVAIFRIAEMVNPSAGYDLLYIYTKKHDGWEQQMLIHAGAW